MFNNIRECSPHPPRAHYQTNPPPPDLAPRQLAALRLILLGRCGRAVARELEVEEHTITRWRRMPAFAAELARQHQRAVEMLFSRQRVP